MFRVLIADDEMEERELLRREIERAMPGQEMKFLEAPSVSRARELLKAHPFDLLTLDIEFDRLDEGIDALPELFENHPALNIIVVSGKLNKSEVTTRLFRFTRDNILKGKRWARHFDVLDKKDDKTEAIQRALSYASARRETAERVKELFTLAEGYLERGDYDKCLETYGRIQEISPGESESGENIRLIKGEGFTRAVEYLRSGDQLVAALLLGHHIEQRLKVLTRRAAGRSHANLYECLQDIDRTHKLSPYKRTLFQKLIKLRNRAVHSPAALTEKDFTEAEQQISLIEADF